MCKLTSHEELAQQVDTVMSALRGIASMGATIAHYTEHPGVEFGALCGILADRLSHVYVDLGEWTHHEQAQG